MNRRNRKGISIVALGFWGAVYGILASCAGFADSPVSLEGIDGRSYSDVPVRVKAVNQEDHDARESRLEHFLARGRQLGSCLIVWYQHTPPSDRVTWGGLVACAGLGLVVLLERMVRLRERKVVPYNFTARFVDQLHEGKLDCGQAPGSL